LSDNQNGNYTIVISHDNTTVTSTIGIAYIKDALAGPTTVTMNLSGTTNFIGLGCQSWTGSSGTFTLDSPFTQGQDGTTANPTSGTAQAPNNSNELVIGNILNNSTLATVGANYTLIDNMSTVGMNPEYWSQTTPTATNAPYVNGVDQWTDQRAGFSFISTPTCGTPSQLSPNFSGTYTVPPTVLPLTVGFTSPTAGCNMFYTSDGSTPTCSSTAYPGGNFSLAAAGSYTYRVVACQTGFNPSAPAGGTWTIVNNSTFSNLTVTNMKTTKMKIQ